MGVRIRRIDNPRDPAHGKRYLSPERARGSRYLRCTRPWRRGIGKPWRWWEFAEQPFGPRA